MLKAHSKQGAVPGFHKLLRDSRRHFYTHFIPEQPSHFPKLPTYWVMVLRPPPRLLDPKAFHLPWATLAPSTPEEPQQLGDGAPGTQP